MKNWTVKRPRWRAERRATMGVARQLRHEQTAVETILWDSLRDRRLAGLKLRRQHIHRRYVLDFYCAEHNLAIEIDGPAHRRQVREDAARTAVLNEAGIRVIRFWNEEVEKDIAGVLKRILEACK